jgi:hypothetical protein
VVELLRSVSLEELRWAQEIKKMAADYPAFRYIERPPHRDLISVKETPLEVVERVECGNPVKTWLGTFQPFPPDTPAADVESIIADLKDNIAVDVVENGSLRHSATCRRRRHALPAALRPARRLDQAFLVEIACRLPPGQPIVRALRPAIIPEPDCVAEPYRTPHLFDPLRALCVMFSSDGRWIWERDDGVREYADQTSFWLAKYLVWCETTERLGSGKGIWIGDAVGHDDRALFRRLVEIGPDRQCYCERGRTYEACHRPPDLAEAHRIFVVLAGARVRQGLTPPRRGSASAPKPVCHPRLDAPDLVPREQQQVGVAVE